MNEPYSIPAEQSIIGGILQDNSAIELVLNVIKPRMFYLSTHQEIFKGIEFLYQKGDGVDVVSISNLSENISEAYLYECINTALGVANLKTHIGIVLECYIKRVLLTQSSKIQEDVGNQAKTALDIAKEVSESLNNIITFKSRSKLVTPDNILSIFDQIRNERYNMEFIMSGYPVLNSKLVAGFPIRTISIIAGCGSNLKSTFRSNLELQLCEQGIGVMSVAAEQDYSTELSRKIAYMSRVPFGKLISKNGLNDEEKNRVNKSEQYFQENYKYYMYADKGANIASVRHNIERVLNIKKNNLKIVFIDLFSYLKDVMGVVNTPQLIIQGLQNIDQMAQEYNLHFCLLVHIRRDSQDIKKKNEVKRPYINEIKGSGGYQEMARLIFLLHYPKLYNEELVDNMLVVNIAKQSNGEAGVGVNIMYDFQPECFRLDERQEDEGFFYGEEDN